MLKSIFHTFVNRYGWLFWFALWSNSKVFRLSFNFCLFCFKCIVSLWWGFGRIWSLSGLLWIKFSSRFSSMLYKLFCTYSHLLFFYWFSRFNFKESSFCAFKTFVWIFSFQTLLLYVLFNILNFLIRGLFLNCWIRVLLFSSNNLFRFFFCHLLRLLYFLKRDLACCRLKSYLSYWPFKLFDFV